MKQKGFTLIELLAVIIILAVIALIATPIVLNVVDNAKESARQSSISGYADATRLAVTEYQFGHDGQTPKLDQTFIDTIKPQGNKVICDEILYTSKYSVVLHGCTIENNSKKYYFSLGKIYTDENNEEYKTAYDFSTEPKIAKVITEDSLCIKKGECSIEQIKKGIKLEVEVNSTEKRFFYVISNNLEEVTLLMDSNLDIDKNGINDDKIAWQSSGKKTDGPITALEELEKYTSSWSNIKEMTYNLTGTNLNDYNGCNKNYDCNNNSYSIESRKVRARLPRVQEMKLLGCTKQLNSCPSWSLGKPTYYWTSSIVSENTTHDAWDISSNINYDRVFNTITGIRPVITISTKDIR